MKRVRVILISCVMVMALLFGGTAYAQIDEELPSPGITPDSPFYLFDTWGEKIGLFFTFGAEAKAKKALEYAKERLAEAHAMADKNKPNAVTKAANGYNEYVAIAIEKIEDARKKGEDVSKISEIVALATSKHLSVLDRVMGIAPKEAKGAIAKAKGVSINGQENTLRALAKENPKRATEINLASVKGRLDRAKEKAERNQSEEAEEALQEFEELNKFGEEISQIARELGKDTTTVDRLVAEATSIHLEILAEVYEKVPDQAKPAIERAMNTSIKGHERAVERLKGKAP
jgi:hypothetical protein